VATKGLILTAGFMLIEYQLAVYFGAGSTWRGNRSTDFASLAGLRASGFVPLAVPMSMMQIRIMNMLVPHRRVSVPMGMRFRYWPIMLMLMMTVMHMAVFVL
jgi:hypothetical protein